MPALAPHAGFRPVALPVYGDFPPPPGYVLESKPNSGLIIGGALTFGTSYALGLIFGAANDFEQGLGYAAIPLAGPWIALGARNFECAPASNPSDPAQAQAAADACQDATIENGLAAAVLAGTGVAQLVGATLVVVGFIDRKEAWVRGDLMELGSDGAALRFDATPTMTGGLFRLSGRF